MFRLDLERKVAIETGPTLLYSLGPTGEIAVSLYPCRSSLARTPEDQVFIAIGNYTAHQLTMLVPSHIQSLTAYGYVSSLDTDATLSEKIHVWWLRNSRPTLIDQKFVTAKSRVGVYNSASAASRAIIVGAVTAVFRPVAFIVVAYILIRLGFADWTKFITPK